MPTETLKIMKLAALAAVLGLCVACTVAPDPPDNRPRVEQVQAASFNAPHGVEFKAVSDGSSYAKELLQQVALDRQRSVYDPVTADEDRWRLPDGTQATDFFLSANTPEVLTKLVTDHGAPPPGQEVALGQRPDGSWRTYLVSSETAIDRTGIARASDTTAADGHRAVDLWLTPSGQHAFADLTGHSIGHKIAVLVDGHVVAAPIVLAQTQQPRITLAL